MPSVIIPFPAPVVHLRVEVGPAVELRRTQVVVDHDGRLYPLHALLAQLPDQNLLLLNQEAPQSGQAAWDFVTKHWPALADCLAAGVEPVSVKP